MLADCLRKDGTVEEVLRNRIFCLLLACGDLDGPGEGFCSTEPGSEAPEAAAPGSIRGLWFYWGLRLISEPVALNLLERFSCGALRL